MRASLPKPGLRLRILLVALLPLLLGVGLLAAYFAHHALREAEQSLDDLGGDTAHHLGEAVAADLLSGNLPGVKRFLDYERGIRGIPAIAVTDGHQWLLVSGDTSLLPALAASPVPQHWRRGTLHYYSHPIRLPASGEADLHLDELERDGTKAAILLALSRDGVERTRYRVLLAATGMAGLSLLLALLLAWRLAGGISSPLRALTRTVARLADGNLHERSPMCSTGEIGVLEDGVNRMAAALEENRLKLESRVRAATAELRGQKLAAEAAALAKSRFLAAASHDLRQPLHALTLLVAALRERLGDAESRRLAEHIAASTASMESLLNALLDLSRLDAGAVEVHPTCFPLDEALKSLEHPFMALARERGLRFVIRPTALWAHTDAALLERILANLVSNALRYTERGGVLIGARRAGDDRIRLEVWDTGRGIPEEFQARIFEEYFQLDNPERHRDKGLGLGLAIVARLAHLLGGQVSVRSHTGRGSCFRLEVARCAPASGDMAAQPSSSPGFALPLENVQVAFIDDDEAILDAMLAVFDHWGVGLAAGTDAEQVRDELLALGRSPDVILCDYRLRSGGTGIDAINLLRQAFGERVPAALLTGDTAPDVIQAISASGLPVLHKPLKPAKLRAFLSYLLAGGSGSPPHAPSPQ